MGEAQETCTWCGVDVPADDGFRLYAPDTSARATFCRLEHVVPWTIKGARWGPATSPAPARADEEPPSSREDGPIGPSEQVATCAECEIALDRSALSLVRHRGPHRIADGFCGIEHLASWAKAGGRWR